MNHLRLHRHRLSLLLGRTPLHRVPPSCAGGCSGVGPAWVKFVMNSLRNLANSNCRASLLHQHRIFFNFLWCAFGILADIWYAIVRKKVAILPVFHSVFVCKMSKQIYCRSICWSPKGELHKEDNQNYIIRTTAIWKCSAPWIMQSTYTHSNNFVEIWFFCLCLGENSAQSIKLTL